jgi:hypothetical protein
MSQGTPNFGPQLNQVVQAVRAELQGVTNQHAAWVRQQIDTKYKDIDARLGDMAKIAQALIVSRHDGSIEWPGKGGDGGIRRIEDIPGRRVPFTMTVDIPIGHDTTSVQQQSVTISQDGPFVAVRRIATFMSQYQYSVTNGAAVAKFAGRSFGRYRPIHSAGDLLDAQSNCVMDSGAMLLNDLSQAVALKPPVTNMIMTAFPGYPSSQSNYRSMEFDGRIQVINAGSSYPRQKDAVPSVFWSQNISDPFDLAALDFFERGEIITVMVQPNHVNNPPVGNVNGDTIWGAVGGYPYLAGQYDQHEGIAYPQGTSQALGGQMHYEGGNIVISTTEQIQRLPDGILTIGWEGYRIQQPVGPA